MEVPLHELQPKAGPAKAMLDVHCSLVALVKDAKGEVVQKLARDRGFQVTADQLKMGNFLDKMTVTLPAGKYSLESAVMDRESGKIGTQRSEFTVPAKAAGVAISSLDPMRSYTPERQGARPERPVPIPGRQRHADHGPDGQEGTERRAAPVLHGVSGCVGLPPRPPWKSNFCRRARASRKSPCNCPPPMRRARIPYLMTIPAESIPSGSYEVRATARQGASTADASTMIVSSR